MNFQIVLVFVALLVCSYTRATELPEILVNMIDHGHISEWSNEGTVPGVIFVRYNDYAALSCYVDNEYFKLSQLAEDVYTLSLQHSLDKEYQSEHHVNITCSDVSVPERSSVVSVVVSVKDENDNSPVFPKDVYHVSVLENEAIGTLVFVASAIDRDEGLNSQIKYGIASNTSYDSNVFSIDPQSGKVTTRRILDREEIDKLTFTIFAKDHGIPPLETTIDVFVQIKDVNDNAPMFALKTFNFASDANVPNGSIVAELPVYDVDKGVNGQITCSLSHGDGVTVPFDVLPTTCQIFTTRLIGDADRGNTYDFITVALDGGLPPLTSSVSISIFVNEQ